MGASYAVFTDTFKSDKKQVVEVGSTKIELIEPSTGLSLGSVEEMSDSNGLNQENYYSFSVRNTGDSDTKYNLYLLDDADTISTYEGTLLADKYLRVGLTKNDTELGPLNLDTQKRLIDTGIINAGATNNYKLRLWLNFDGLSESEKDLLDGQSKFLKLKLTGEQNFSNTLGDTIIKRDLKTNMSDINGLFATNDTNSGKPTYYYKGEVDNNYVSFANMLWRIVRINEDGSIRLILNDGIDTKTGYMFNSKADNYKYMYYSESKETGIMKATEDWYKENLLLFDDMIVTGIFCEQAKVKREEFISTSTPMKNPKEYKPSFKCVTDGNGKGILNLKVGLLMIDEAILISLPMYSSTITSSDYNPNTYIQKDYNFWTMSASGFYNAEGGRATAWYIATNGLINNNHAVWVRMAIRPVINIKNELIATGDGSLNAPYILKN